MQLSHQWFCLIIFELLLKIVITLTNTRSFGMVPADHGAHLSALLTLTEVTRFFHDPLFKLWPCDQIDESISPISCTLHYLLRHISFLVLVVISVSGRPSGQFLLSPCLF